jgi:DNA-binding response OmpR family regulator
MTAPELDRSHDRPTILAVDDEPEVLGFLETFLEGEGFAFVPASSGAEAIELARERRPNLVIVDVMMPGMNGLELCAELRESRATSDVPIILYSAYDMQKHSNTGLYDRAFVKPADPDEMLWAIRTLTSQPS